METLNTSVSVPDPTPLGFSDEDMEKFDSIGILTILVAMFGIFTNMVNMSVFIKIGLTSTTNICFFVLSLADFISVSFIVFKCLRDVSDMSQWRVPGKTLLTALIQVFYVASVMGSWVTTLLTLERCCCVVFPLQVKNLFTIRMISIAIVLFFLLQVVASIVFYQTYRLVEIPLPGSNRSQLYLYLDPENIELNNNIKFVSFSIPTLICFTLVVLGTVTLIRSLKKNQSVRKSMTSTGTSTKSEKKEATTVKCVVFICILYIVGYFINTFKRFVSLGIPQFHERDPVLGNIAEFLIILALLLQAVCCSVNILVYTTMNSRFRAVLVAAIGRGSKLSKPVG